MYPIFRVCILIILSSLFVESLFALGCDEIRGDLPESSEMISAVEQCLQARESGNPSSITEFVCPQGEFFAQSSQPITRETVAYLVAVQISFDKVDKDIQKYMKQLQKTREADPVKWVEASRICSEKIQTIYTKICSFGTLESLLNGDKKNPYIVSTNTYPQTLCNSLSQNKISGWKYLQNILAADGISKNQKNSTDTWINGVKGKYATVLGSWHSYQRILARAVSKMTGYTKESN